MIKKTIYISKPCSIHLKNCQMEVSDKETGDVRTVPVEDIGIVVVENQRTSFTIPVLNALADNNVSVVFCNDRMMPHSILLPFEGNTVQSETYRLQMDSSEPLKKQLWKQIIEAKIRNQAAVLDAGGKDGAILKSLYSNVKSGDSDNKEGLAARIYWGQVFHNEFVRDQDGGDGLNAMLNYGYAILRAAMARAIVGSGLSLSYGLFHKNRYNAFPLADDLMEPFRPYVDISVAGLWNKGICELNRESKVELLSVLTCDIVLDDVLRPLEVGLTITTASLVKCLRGEAKKLILPSYVRC